jgi:hypothetical protein
MMEKAKKAPEAFEPDEVNGWAGGRLAPKRHPGAHVEPALEAVIQTPKLGLESCATNYLAFVQLASIRRWLSANESPS